MKTGDFSAGIRVKRLLPQCRLLMWWTAPAPDSELR